MAVLVEALCLVVPRTVLDISYPGGADAFMTRMCDPAVPCRLVCADERLVSVSFLGAAEAEVVERELCELGIVAVDDDRFAELAFVDQRAGPTLPCDWLEWGTHDDGFTYCWVAGTDPDPLHVPEGWTPEQSRNLVFQDLREEPGRCIKLADENGREIWLDLHTGRQFAAPAPAAGPADEPSDSRDEMTDDTDEPQAPDTEVLLDIVRASLDAQGYHYQESAERWIMLTIRCQKGAYRVMATANDRRPLVRVICGYGSYVPEARRTAVAEAIARINFNIAIGCFDLDFTDGELRFRSAIDVEQGTLSTTMVDNMIGYALHSLDRYHDALMRVAFAGEDPEAALVQAA
jgi:hypothetical protein